MPEGVKIEIDASEVLAKFGKLKNAIPKDVDNAVQAGALDIERDAKQYCPVDTGRLRSSITAAKVMDGVATVSTDVEYAQYQEYGTMYMPAQPFMMPALIVNEDQIRENIKRAVNQNL